MALWFILYIQHSKYAVSLPSGGESKPMNQLMLLSCLAVCCCSKGKTERDPIVTATAILKITGLGNIGEDEEKKCVFLFQMKKDPDDLFGWKQLAGAAHLFCD